MSHSRRQADVVVFTDCNVGNRDVGPSSENFTNKGTTSSDVGLTSDSVLHANVLHSDVETLSEICTSLHMTAPNVIPTTYVLVYKLKRRNNDR